MGIEQAKVSDVVSAGLVMNPAYTEGSESPFFTYRVECVAPDGAVKWTEEIHNVVTRVGKGDLIDKYFKGSTYTAAWYMGLKGTGTAASTDTLASHAGWTEVTPYSGNRPAITFGTTSTAADTVTNQATAVAYTINATATVAGAFVAAAASGTSAILYSASDFSASRSVASGDTLNVTLTISMA